MSAQKATPLVYSVNMALMLDFELDNKKDYVKTLWPKKRLPKENLIIYQRKAKCLYWWDESAITKEMFFFFLETDVRLGFFTRK